MKKRKLLWAVAAVAVLAVVLAAAAVVPGSRLTGYLADEGIQRVELTMTRETSEDVETVACVTLDEAQYGQIAALMGDTWFCRAGSTYARETEYRYYLTGYDASGVSVLEVKITDGKRVELHYAPGDSPQVQKSLNAMGEGFAELLDGMIGG